jgi:hypothetical protein
MRIGGISTNGDDAVAMRVITVHDYNTNPEARELADSLIGIYGMSRDEIDQMMVDDRTVRFHILNLKTHEGKWLEYDR